MKTSSPKYAWLQKVSGVPNALIFIFLLIWPLPVLYYGLTNHPAPWLSEFLQRRTNVSRLFSSEQKTWAVYAIQFRSNDNDSYETLDEVTLFHMKPFGRRTRLQRIIATADEDEMEILCSWIAKRLETPAKQRITSVRIVAYPNKRIGNDFGAGYSQALLRYADPTAVRVIKQINFPGK